MALVAAERIKLFSTRSPWWSALAALAFTVGLAGLSALTADDAAQLSVGVTQSGAQFGLMVVMVMAALAVTTEYRFSTIRTTFQAVPNRAAALLAKTAVVAVLAAVIGEVASFGSWAAASVLRPAADLAIDSGAEWRELAGSGLVFAVTAVIAVAVGVLVRHSAGALSILLIYMALVENLVTLIPNVGDDLYRWMPFVNARHFLSGDGAGMTPYQPSLSPWASLAYFAAYGVVLLVIALGVARKRDA